MEGCEERNRSQPGALLYDSRAEPLDQPRLAYDQAVAVSRAGKRSITAHEAETDMRRCLRQQLRSDVAEAALIKDQEVEPTEV